MSIGAWYSLAASPSRLGSVPAWLPSTCRSCTLTLVAGPRREPAMLPAPPLVPPYPWYETGPDGPDMPMAEPPARDEGPRRCVEKPATDERDEKCCDAPRSKMVANQASSELVKYMIHRMSTKAMRIQPAPIAR